MRFGQGNHVGVSSRRWRPGFDQRAQVVAVTIVPLQNNCQSCSEQDLPSFILFFRTEVCIFELILEMLLIYKGVSINRRQKYKPSSAITGSTCISLHQSSDSITLYSRPYTNHYGKYYPSTTLAPAQACRYISYPVVVNHTCSSKAFLLTFIWLLILPNVFP